MEALFLKLVNMSITASWLVLAVLILRVFLKKAPKSIRCVLWGLVGLRLVFPFSLESMFSLIPSTEPLPEEFLYAAAPQVNTGVQALNNAVNPVIAQSLTPVEPASANPTQIWSFIFSHIWLIGVILMAVYALVSYLVVRRKVSVSIKLGKNLRLCDSIDTPFILGIIRPQIYLPSNLDQQTADHVLAHENAHLKRKDHWWKPLGFALLTVYWFNPVMWLAYILLCRDIEMACDEKVVKDFDAEHKKAYSEALLRCSVPRRLIAACPLAFGEVGVKDRIKSVLHYKKPAFWIMVVAVIACIIVAVCFLTDPKGNDWEKECRAILDQIQSSENYHIRVEEEFEGELILNNWNKVEYWKYRDIQLFIVKNQDGYMLDGVWYDGSFGSMSLGGEYYEGISASQQMAWQKQNVSKEISDPWLYTFDMDAQDVKATARKETDEGYEIRLMVYGPCDSGSIKCDKYYVDFCFDREGNFRYAVRYIHGSGELMGETLPQSIISTIYAYEPTEADYVSAMKAYAGNLEQELNSYLDSATQLEKELAECKAVLDETQRSKNYHILSQRQFEGDGFGNDASESEFWKQGDDWLRISRDPATGNALAYMGVDGLYFDNVWMKENGWQQVDMSMDAIFDPWLYSFDWNAQEIKLIDTQKTEAGHSVMLQIMAPYDLEWISSEDYTAEFIFDAAGNFEKVVITAKFEEKANGQTDEYSVVETLTVRGTDASAISAAIDEQYGQTEQGQLYPRQIDELDDITVRIGEQYRQTEPEQPVRSAMELLAELKAEDIASIDNPRISAEEIAPALNKAAENPVERTEDIHPFWFEYVYLSGSNEYFALSAGPEENIVRILYRNGEMLETCYVEDAALYQIIRSSAYPESVIDEIALAEYEDILRAQVEETMRQGADTWQFTGYAFTEFTRLDTFEKDGTYYEVYAWDAAFLVDDPTQAVMAGGMGIDGQLRVRGLEQNTYFVVTQAGGTLDYRFFNWELYLGPQETGQANAWSKIREAFGLE